MPIEKEDLQEYGGATGEFIGIRKLAQPGQTVTVKLLDLQRNYKTKFPIKDKEFNYRLTLEKDGKRYLMDLNGADSIKQVVAALYPHGLEGSFVPCFATLTRRTERKTYQGEMEVIRGDPLTFPDSSAIPF